jgi:arsenate reductase
MLNTLVICTGNSCRSIIGEALFNHLGKGRIKAFSAGSQPLGRLNVDAIALLQRHGIATEGLSSKSWVAFENQPIDIVITVCDNAAGGRPVRSICVLHPRRIGACPIQDMSRVQTMRL